MADLAQSLAWDGAGLLTILAGIADSRCRRGICHQLPAILGLAVCAALAKAIAAIVIVTIILIGYTVRRIGGYHRISVQLSSPPPAAPGAPRQSG